MPRKILVPLMLITMLALFSISATAADDTDLTLKSIDYIEGKGLVLKFEGDVSELGGLVTIGDKQYQMDCSLGDDGVWTCVAFVPRSHFGDTADVQLGDYSFEVTVRQPRPQLESPPEFVPAPDPPPDPCGCLSSSRSLLVNN